MPKGRGGKKLRMNKNVSAKKTKSNKQKAKRPSRRVY